VSKKLENMHEFEFVRSDGLQLSDNDFPISNWDRVLPSLRTIMMKPWNFLFFVNELLELTKSSKCEKNVFLMPSPLDYFIYKILKLKKQECFFLIHDASPHPGEFWPRKGSINWRLRKADGVIFLSNFVFQTVKTRLNTKNYKIFPHPPFSSFTNHPREAYKNLSSSSELPIMLFVGRIRKYKGIKLLAQYKTQIQEKFQLVIAGEGTLPEGLEGVKTINHWLTETEICELMFSADILIFPYTEASQSGVIPSAIALGKRLIVAEVGGLSEQIKGYSKALTFNPDKPETLLHILERSFKELKEDFTPQKRDELNDQTTFSTLLDQILEVSRNHSP
jgi:glycosyltransferase involved in cell wall biosynthesis